MSNRVPQILMAGGAVGFGYYMFMRPYWFPNPYKTQGMENIEKAHTRGGGTPNSTPATATERGNESDTTKRDASGYQGPDSKRFDKSINDQKSEVSFPSSMQMSIRK